MGKGRKVALFLDPASRHFLADRLFNVTDGRLNGDRILAPYAYLRDVLAAKGIPVRTADYLPGGGGDVQNVYVSMGMLQNYARIARRGDATLSAFFAMECPIADPSLYRELGRVQGYFNRIFSWSDSASLEEFAGRRLRLESFRWPQSFDDAHEAVWRRRERQFLVMINANKRPRVTTRELYSERLRCLDYFSRRREIDLYGPGWDGPAYRRGSTWLPGSIRGIQRRLLGHWQRLRPDPLLEAARRVYRGPARSKADILGRYTFAVCFENMILKGWITEKIFDCFFAGTIPIYWGAPDIGKYVPPGCFIDMRNFRDYANLSQHLDSLGEADIRRHKESARKFLRSSLFYPFSKQAFVELFLRIIREDTGVEV